MRTKLTILFLTLSSMAFAQGGFRKSSSSGGITPAGARQHTGWTSDGTTAQDTLAGTFRIDKINARFQVVDADNDTVIIRPQHLTPILYKDATTALFSVDSTGLITTASVDSGSIVNGVVTTADLRTAAVTADKLASTAVTAGSYTNTSITVDADGRLTAASSGGSSGITPAGARQHTGWTSDGTTAQDTLASRYTLDRANMRIAFKGHDNDSLIFHPAGNRMLSIKIDGTTEAFYVDTTGVISTKGSAGNNSEKIGANTSVVGTGNVVFGANSSITQTTSDDNVLLGENIDVTGAGSDDNIFIGSEHQATAGTVTRVINLGWGTTVPASASGSFFAGSTLHTQGTLGSNECWFGGANAYNNFWFGQGKSQASPNAIAFNATNAVGTNNAAGSWTFKAGLATGNSATGVLNFQTGQTGASGTTIQTARTRVNIGVDATSSTASTDSLFNAVGGHFNRGLKVDHQLTARALNVGDTTGFLPSFTGVVNVTGYTNVAFNSRNATTDTITALTGTVGQIVIISSRDSKDVIFLDGDPFFLNSATRTLSETTDRLILICIGSNKWVSLMFIDND